MTTGGKDQYLGRMDMGPAPNAIEKVDGYTVKITLNAPDAALDPPPGCAFHRRCPFAQDR